MGLPRVAAEDQLSLPETLSLSPDTMAQFARRSRSPSLPATPHTTPARTEEEVEEEEEEFGDAASVQSSPSLSSSLHTMGSQQSRPSSCHPDKYASQFATLLSAPTNHPDSKTQRSRSLGSTGVCSHALLGVPRHVLRALGCATSSTHSRGAGSTCRPLPPPRMDYDDVGWVGDEVAEVAQAAKEQVVNQWRKCRASARQGQRQLLKTDHAPASKGCSKARRKANNERRRWLASLPGNPESLGDEQVASVKRHAAVAFAHAVEKLGTAARALTRVLQAEAVAKRATTDVDPSKRMVRNRVS
jgi:hypothetical protein